MEKYCFTRVGTKERYSHNEETEFSPHKKKSTLAVQYRFYFFVIGTLKKVIKV